MGSYCSTPAAKEVSAKDVTTERPERTRSDSLEDTYVADESADEQGSSESTLSKPGLVPSETDSVDSRDSLKDSIEMKSIPSVPPAAGVAVVESDDAPTEESADESNRSVIITDYDDEDLAEEAAAFDRFFNASMEDGLSCRPPTHTEAQQSYDQLFSMLAAPTIEAQSLEEAAVKRRHAIAEHGVIYPPLRDATFAIEIVKISFADVHAVLASARSVSAPYDEGLFTDDKVEILAGEGKRGAGKRRKAVSVKAYYEHSGAQIVRKSDDYDGLKSGDSDTVEVREVLNFDLGVTKDEIPRDMTMIDEDAEPETDSLDDEHVEGQIELVVREKKKHVAVAEIKLDDLLDKGMISRRGQWTDLNLVMYEKKPKRKTMLVRALSMSTKDSEKKEKARKQVGFITVRCRLHWTPESLRAFADSQKSVSVDRPLDKMTLMASHLANLKLTVLGAVFDSDAMDVWKSLNAAQMSKMLARSKVAVDDEEKHKDIVIVGEYKCADSDVVEKHSGKHSSSDDKMLFFGEQLEFDVLPFAFHGVGESSVDHPQLGFRDEKVCAAPGAIFLKLLGKGDVWTKPKEMGCCLLDVNNMFADVSLDTGKTASDEFLFIQPLYETLYEVRWTRGLTKPEKFQCGALFLKASFEW